MGFQLHRPLETCWASESASHQITSSIQWLYHSPRISYILLYTFAQYLSVLSVVTTLASGKACCICIQLIVVIILHPHKTLLHPCSDLWLPHFVKSVPYIECALSLDTDPVTSLQGTRTSTSTNEGDMKVEHPFLVSVMNLSIQSMN